MFNSAFDGTTAHVLPVANPPPPESALPTAFDTLATRLTRPMALKAVYTAIGLSTSGEGAGDQPALGLAADAMQSLAARWGVAEATEWAEFVRDAERAAGEAAAEGYTAMTKFGDAHAEGELLASIAGLARLDPASRSAIVLESIALEIYGALRKDAAVPSKIAAATLRMARNVRRKKPGRDWQMLYDLEKLSEEGLKRVVRDAPDGECRLLAMHLLGRWTEDRSLSGLPVEVPTQSSGDEPAALAKDGSAEGLETGKRKGKGKRKDRRKGKRGPQPDRVPSVAVLRARAANAKLHHAYSVDRVWDRLDANSVAEVTQKLEPLLAPKADLQMRCMAVHALMAQRISHDYRPALRLRLQLLPGETPDLWYDRASRCLKFSRKRQLNLKGPADPDDIQSVPIPAVLADAIEALWQLHPTAQELGHLLGFQSRDLWLAQVERFISRLGDPAHRATSGRFVHSLGLVHLHCGTSDVLTGMLTFNLVHAADGAPHYVGVAEAFAFERVAVVDAFLGLGALSALPADRPFGHPGVPTVEEARSDWTALSLQVARAIFEILGAPDADAVGRSFNTGMAAAAAAYRWPTGARDQAYQRLSLTDATVHPVFVYQDDKKTKPPSSRLIPRTLELDQVISAVAELRRVATARLRALGARDEDLPALLQAPRPEHPLFVQLKVVPSLKGGMRVIAQPLRAKCDSLKKLVRGTDTLRRHAARCFWMSTIALAPSCGWHGRALGGHARRDAGLGGWCQGMPPALLLDDLARFMRQTLDSLALPPFLQQAQPAPQRQALPLVLDLQRFARRADPWAHVSADLPQHYCVPSTLTAMCIAIALRGCLGAVMDDLDAPAHALLSLMAGSGFTSAEDVRRVWASLPEQAAGGLLRRHVWQRESGQEIEMPAQPWTAVHISRVKAWPSLNKAATSLRIWLQGRFSAIAWPQETGALLTALGWIVGLWARVIGAPIVLHCHRPETRAATFDAASRKRLREGWSGAIVAPTVTTEGTGLVPVQDGGKSEMKRLVTAIWDIVGTGGRKGEDIKLANALRPHLKTKLDIEACFPVTRWLLRWVDQECIRLQQRIAKTNDLNTVYNNLTALRERLDKLEIKSDLDAWDHRDWSEFREAALDVTEIPDEKSRAVALEARRKALNRIVRVLSEAGLYPACRAALSNESADEHHWWPDSASRVFVPDQVLDAVRADVRGLYANAPLELAQAQFLLELTLDGAARRDESTTVCRDKVSEGLVAMAATGFNRRKTDDSSRIVVLAGALTAATLALCGLSDELYDARTALVSQRGLVVNLRFGRARQAVLVDLLRQRLVAPEFQWHTLRGVGVMAFLLGPWQPLVRRLLREHMPLEAACELMRALAGASPSHAANSFNRSGHANNETPCAAYLPCWTDLHAAMYRAAPGVPEPSLELVRAAQLEGRNQQSLNQARHLGKDIWQWVITPSGQRLQCGQVADVSPETACAAGATVDLTDAAPGKQVRFGVLNLLGFSRNAGMTHAPMSTSQAERIEAKLQAALPLSQLHRSAVQRADEDMVNVRKMLRDFMGKPPALDLVEAIANGPPDAVQALQQLLMDTESWLSVPRLRLALRALPLSMGLQVTWRLGCVDNRLVKALRALQETRVVVTDPSANVTGSIRLSVIAMPSAGTGQASAPDPRHIASLSTTARIALEVHHLIF